MKAWRWHCTTHQLDLLTVQTGANPPATCNAFVDIVWPDDGPCWFHGSPVLHMFPDRGLPVRSPDSHLRSGTPPTAGGAAGEAGRVTTPPLPATRHSTT